MTTLIAVIALILRIIFWGVVFFVFTSMWIAWGHKKLRQKYPDDTERREGREPHVRPALWARALAVEFCATLLYVLLSFTVMIRRRATPPRGIPRERPVLLIHGYNHNETGWLYLRRKLAAAGYGPVYSLNLRPVFGDIRAISECVVRRMDRIRAECGDKKVILIGHSMGGMVSATYTELLGGAEHVEQVITLGSPIRGTAIAGMGVGMNALQMLPTSAFVENLNEKMRASKVPYTHIATQLDNLVFPYENAFLEDEAPNNILFNHLGHVALIASPVIARAILDRLERAD